MKGAGCKDSDVLVRINEQSPDVAWSARRYSRGCDGQGIAIGSASDLTKENNILTKPAV